MNGVKKMLASITGIALSALAVDPLAVANLGTSTGGNVTSSNGGTKSGVALAKRKAKKLQNVRARSSKR